VAACWTGACWTEPPICWYLPI